MSNILIRSFYGGIYVAILILAVLFYAQIALVVFGLMAGIALFEFNRLVSSQGYQLSSKLYLTFGLFAYLLFGLAGLSYGPIILWGLLPLFFLFLMIQSLFSKDKNAVISGILGLGGWVYILLPLTLIHFLYGAKGSGEIVDYWPVLGMMILTWTSDTFAYLSGRFFGKTKLFERISPKKTWEGVIGGVLFSLLASVLIFYFEDRRPIYFWLVLGLIVPVFGILGDLFESLMKRTAGVKDSGNLIPGHGGILDRIDAMLFTIPATFAWIFLYGLIK